MGGWICPIIGASLLGAFLLLGFALYLHDRYVRITNRRPRDWWRVRRGKGLAVVELARRLGMDEHELRAFKPSYRKTAIPKRRGGTRVLLIPDARTKALQRRLLRRLFARLRAHPAACGFERGKSIVDNARPHANQCVVIRMDVVDFFPSTAPDRLTRYFQRIGWDREAAELLVRLCTLEGGLPQGAPTSPRLSNLVNYLLDAQIAAFVRRRKGQYTRYADDITISFPKDYPSRIRGTIQKVKRILKHHGYRAHQKKKLSIRRRHQRQVVTGLVVNGGVRLPRRQRMRLRAMRHHLKVGKSITLSPQQLQGHLAFAKMVEAK